MMLIGLYLTVVAEKKSLKLVSFYAIILILKTRAIHCIPDIVLHFKFMGLIFCHVYRKHKIASGVARAHATIKLSSFSC